VIETPILQLHGADDGCVLPPDDSDAHRFARRELLLVPGAGHFVHLEQPEATAARVDAWLTDASPAIRSSR
jgi:pimeloyl-ACP methyl ester carboxylesterase